MSVFRTLVASSVLSCATSSAFAQAPVTVQQPVVGRFAADTVLSVPDRGHLFLGGVSSAGDSQQRFGPLPSGTATGRFRSRSSLNASVFIHDFEAMDAALLSRPRIQADRHPRIPSPRAAAAWRHLHEQGRRVTSAR